jgi:hypothetical protein
MPRLLAKGPAKDARPAAFVKLNLARKAGEGQGNIQVFLKNTE